MTKYLFQMRQWLMVIALCSAFVACKDDAGEDLSKPDEVATGDANAVSSALAIPGASLLQGNPPVPTNSANAPVLSTDNLNNEKSAFPGKPFRLDLDVTQGDVAGVYLKVKGSDSYLNIPASSLKNGRISLDKAMRVSTDQKKTNGGLFQREKNLEFGVLEIGLPDNFKPGTFCVQYCVYDAASRVSNWVEVCIEVVAFGGSNSAYLTQHSWSTLYHYVKWYDEVMTFPYGTNEVDVYDVEFYCNDGTYKILTVEEIERYEYLYLTFANSGALRVEEKYYSKWRDFETSSCEAGIQYKEENFVWDETGAWSYDDTTKELVMLFVENYEGEEPETDIFKFKVSVVNGELHLVENAGTDSEWGLVLKQR